MKKIKLFVSILIFISTLSSVAYAEVNWQNLYLAVTSKDVSASTPAAKKTDKDWAAVKITSGISWYTSNVYLRLRYTHSGKAATEMKSTSGNGYYNLSYLSNYGFIGEWYHLNASKTSSLRNPTIEGKWAP